LPTTLTLIASSGGRFAWKKTLAPQANIALISSSGTIVHDSSSASEERSAGGRSSAERRRKWTAKNKSAIQIPIANSAVTPRMNRKRASTSGAIVDACSGARGKAGFIGLRSESAPRHPACGRGWRSG
jgi:hypothetical protein